MLQQDGAVVSAVYICAFKHMPANVMSNCHTLIQKKPSNTSFKTVTEKAIFVNISRYGHTSPSKPQKLTRHLPLLNPDHPVNHQFSRSNITLLHCQRMLVLQPKVPPRDMYVPLPPLQRSTIPRNRLWPLFIWIRPQPLSSPPALHIPPAINNTTPNTNILPHIRPPPNPQLRAPRVSILLRPRVLRHVKQSRETRRHLPRLRTVAQGEGHVVDVVPAPPGFVVADGRTLGRRGRGEGRGGF